MFNFEKLEVWRKSIAFAGLVYEITRSFPTDERYALTAQIRRASVSVASNIAEGSARPPADFSKFLGYATGSLFEVITQATIAKNQAFIGDEDFQRLKETASEISRMLSGLRTSLEK